MRKLKSRRRRKRKNAGGLDQNSSENLEILKRTTL